MEICIEKAQLKDSHLLGIAIRDAERGHTGKGIWDVLISSDQMDIALILEHACINDANSFFHISRFLVAREKSTGELLATACGFIYPNCSIEKNKFGISKAISTLYGLNEEEIDLAWKRLNFLDECFPDVDYNNSWMVEAVYTMPSHRGKGLAAKVIEAVLEEGRTHTDCKKALITCAIGNNAALHLYLRLGFEIVGQGESRKAVEELGHPGFYVLCLYFKS